MAFDFGAALTAAGNIQPALQTQQQKEAEQKRVQQSFEQQQRSSALMDLYRKSELDKLNQQNQIDKEMWHPIRSYKAADGMHTIYLTPTGHQDVLNDPGPKTYKQFMDEAAPVFGGIDKVPEWYRNAALAKSEGLNYKQAAERYTKTTIPSKESPTGYLSVDYEPFSGQVYTQVPTIPPRGWIPSQNVTIWTDPATGLTYVRTTTHNPVLPTGNTGASGLPATPASGSSNATPSDVQQTLGMLAGSAAPSRASRPPHADTQQTLAALAGNSTSSTQETLRKLAGSPRSAPRSTTGTSRVTPPALPPLDASGHIPEGVGYPQVREGANQLLDGADKDKLPAKTRELSAALARRYGWSQGTFTPKEQVLLREATNFLREAQTNPALGVLDSSVARGKLSQLMGDPQKRGMFGQLMTLAASSSESPQEAEFVRMYNQLVGTISGLSQLTRSGKATERTIDRLINELPNPLTTASSADAKARLGRLMNELIVAQQKGSFSDDAGRQGGGPSQSAQYSVGDTVKLRDGSTVTVMGYTLMESCRCSNARPHD